MDLRSLEIKVSRSENLPVLPQIVSSVLKLADDPNASPKEMERIVERDPAITAKILRVAGSAYYGGNNVPTIARAISILGMNAIRTLVVGVAYQQIIGGRNLSTNFNKLDFWRHSLAVATTARILAKLKMPSKSEELYCAGMMHDVGILVMDRFTPNELDQAIKNSAEDNLPLHQSEQLLYGFDHSQIGDLLAEKWNLPPILRNAIRYHHDVCEDETQHATTCIIAAANTLAHQCGYTNASPNLSPELEPAVRKVIDLPDEQLEVIKMVVIGELQKAEEAFGIA